MNLLDIVLIVLIAAVLGLAIRHLRRQRGTCHCEGCSTCGKCRRK